MSISFFFFVQNNMSKSKHEFARVTKILLKTNKIKKKIEMSDKRGSGEMHMGFCSTSFRRYLFSGSLSPCGDPYPIHRTSRRFSRRRVRFVGDLLLSNLFLMLDFREGQKNKS